MPVRNLSQTTLTTCFFESVAAKNNMLLRLFKKLL